MDLKGHLSEANHLGQQQADQQIPAKKPLYIGHISAWDPDLGLVKVVNHINANDIDTPGESGWMPLGTLFVGLPTFQGDNQNPLDDSIDYWGFCYGPFAGAIVGKDVKGEQVMVCQVSPDTGYSYCAHMLFNTLALPPSKEIPVEKVQLKMGEWCMVSPTGTTIWSDSKGNIRIYVLQPQGTQDSPSSTYEDGEDNEDHGNLEVVSNGGVVVQTAPRDTVITPPLQGDIDVLADYSINGVATNGGILFQAGFEGEYEEPTPGDINLLAEFDITETALGGISLTAGDDTAVTPLDGEIIATALTDITMLAGGLIDAEAGTEITMTAGTDISAAATASIGMIAGTLITINAGGPITIQSAAMVNVLAPVINIGGDGETFFTLLTSVLGLYLAGHTHPAPGGETGPPTAFPALAYPATTEVLAAG